MTLKPGFLTNYAPNDRCRKNILNSLWDGMAYSVMMGLTVPFVGVYALKLGATNYMVGLLTSLPGFVMLLSQVPAALIVNRYAKRLPVVLRYAFLHRLGYLVFAFIPFMPWEIQAWTFVLLYALINFPGTVCGVSWTTLMGDIFDRGIRGRVFGDRNMLTGIITIVSTLAAGLWLDVIAYPHNFQVLFLVSFAGLMLSLYYLNGIEEVPTNNGASVSNPKGIGNFKVVFRDRSFVAFAVAMLILKMGLNVSAAMWTILYVKVLNLSNSWIASFSIVSGLASAISCRWWGRFGDRKGNTYALLATMILFTPITVLYGLLAKGPWPMVVLSVISGFTVGGFNLSSFNSLLEVSPESERPAYVAVFNILSTLPVSIAPIIGVSIFQASSMMTVFVVSSVVRFLSVVAMWRYISRVSTEME